MAYDIRPTAGELEEARGVVEIALDAADRELPDGLDECRIGLGWTEDSTVRDDFGGAIGLCDPSGRVRVLFNAQDADWTDAVMAATARGVGHAWLESRLPDERIAFHWQAVLAAAAGTILAGAIAPESSTPGSDVGDLAEAWPTLNSHLGDGVATDEVYTSSDVPAYPIVSLGALLGEHSELAELPTLTRSEVIDRLDEALASG